jgi:carbamoyl-phosphate synthase large subunit
MAGATLQSLGFTKEIVPKQFAVKESVFPFNKFPGVDIILGPEMRSTGEVMGIGETFQDAFLKAQLGTGMVFPHDGTVFLSVRDADKPAAAEIGRRLVELGYKLVATKGTARVLEREGVPSSVVNKVKEGRPHVVDALKSNEIQMVVNTTEGAQSITDSKSLRRATLTAGVPYFTTIAAATAAIGAIEARKEHPLTVRALQDYARDK